VQHRDKKDTFSGILDNVPPLSVTDEKMSYTHITPSQRNELSVLLRVRTKQKDIAKLLKKHRTTIWREQRRNGSRNGKYHAGKAKEKAQQRQVKAHEKRRKIENSPWLQRHIRKRISKRWSPEQIGGRLKTRYPDNKEKHVGKDSVYAYIYGHGQDLVKYLRCQKGKYRRRRGTRIREKQREEAEKRRIDTRPGIVGVKGRFGDWEGDTIVGSDRSHILTHTERKSGLLFADRLAEPTAQATTDATVVRFSKVPKRKRLTVTYDNGVTFAHHELTARGTGMDIYFAYPYHAWERGCNENANGLLRQYFPKKTPLGCVSQDEIDQVVDEINRRPRKRLGYLSPYEVFYAKNLKS
jgi:IS30 family transposase